MKGFKILPLIGLAFVSPIALSSAPLHPVLGSYFGMTGGVTYAPSVSVVKDTKVFDITEAVPVTLNYQIGGNGTLEFGYRCGKVRLEVEGLFNYNAYKNIKWGKYTFKANQPKDINFTGDTYYLGGLVNVLYEFYQDGSVSSNWAPYVGVGIGYAGIFNQFTLNVFSFKPYEYTKDNSAPIAQGIVGLGYFMDDWGTISLDYRYLASTKYGDFQSQIRDQTLNIGFTHAFGS